MRSEQLSRLPEILFQIGKAIGSQESSDESLEQTLSTISRLVTEFSGAEACSILLTSPDEQLLLGKAHFGLRHNDASRVSFRYGEGVAGWVAANMEPALLHHAESDSRFVAHGGRHVASLACVPLMYGKSLVGVLTITSREESRFSESTVDLLQLVGTTIALDLENIRLRRVAHTDKLTGTYNREHLDAQFPQAIADASRGAYPLCLAVFDVDHFKSVNDTHGHDVGDKVLSAVAAQLRRGLRGSDTLVRYGGEEFVLLLPKTDIDKAMEIAERIRISLATDAICIGEAVLPVRLSAGVAQLRAGEDAAALFKRADLALYRAKRDGRNRVEFASEPLNPA